jgi:hypothetical protein
MFQHIYSPQSQIVDIGQYNFALANNVNNKKKLEAQIQENMILPSAKNKFRGHVRKLT